MILDSLQALFNPFLILLVLIFNLFFDKED